MSLVDRDVSEVGGPEKLGRSSSEPDREPRASSSMSIAVMQGLSVPNIG